MANRSREIQRRNLLKLKLIKGLFRRNLLSKFLKCENKEIGKFLGIEICESYYTREVNDILRDPDKYIKKKILKKLIN